MDVPARIGVTLRLRVTHHNLPLSGRHWFWGWHRRCPDYNPPSEGWIKQPLLDPMHILALDYECPQHTGCPNITHQLEAHQPIVLKIQSTQ
jgi:hypothetical protein